ncbi:MAG: glycoside hydrolase family 38 C-terminal domain-containing protein [Bacteroidota bacterium]
MENPFVMMRIPLAALLLLVMIANTAKSQTEAGKAAPPLYDLSKQPVLYTVGYAHLDTEWRWDYESTINECLKNTLDDNFSRFEKYKPYVFTFSGARRYKMMKEYYPDKYERLKKYVAQGRWFVGGSSVDECDANIPSPESVIRQVLYGNSYFRSEFGKESVDFLLPDCFGFQAHIPSVLAHAGLLGFSTQKLSWGSANGIPFNLGNWIGPDGNGVVAALNATDYNGSVKKRLDTASYWVQRISENGKKYGLFADYRYYGTGDEGGAPREEDIQNAVGSLSRPGSKFGVYLCSSDQLFRDLDDARKKQLPSYNGDLLLTQHSAGSLTSQASMKRWNRQNEQLAMATEPIAVMADWLGGLRYPLQSMHDAWWLVLGSQMHDILPGTCIPKAYEYAWNDEVLALNKFASNLESSAGPVIRAMDTRGKGVSLMLYNPLAISRTDLAEAEILYPGDAPKAVMMTDALNNPVPVQVLKTTKGSLRILFLATLPSLGLACYDLQPVKEFAPVKTTLSASNSTIENEFLKVVINASGDISSIFDKKLGKEMLSAQSQLVFQKEHPQCWPAWNMDWNDRKKNPVEVVRGPAIVTLTEKGPVRATLKVERNARNSVFTQYIQLAAGKENLVVRNIINWQSRGVSLKASFPLTASNSMATYNLGLGTIERSTNNEKKYEVPSREWFDLTDKSGNFGVTITEDSKFGSDKPDDKTLRLTLLYTPVANIYHDQATQDWGIHEITYGIYSHKGDWRTGRSEWQGRSMNQPVRAFQVPQHAGFLGRSFSFARVSTPQVDIRTIKKGENGKDVIIRLQELFGNDVANVEVALATKIKSAYEVDGQEHRTGEIAVKNGKLLLDMKKFTIRSFALQLEAPVEKQSDPATTELELAYDQVVVSSDKNRKDGRFDEQGLSIPAELFPETLMADGIRFHFGPSSDHKNNVLACRGQKITLPKTGNFNHLYILAAALTDTAGVFKVGGIKTTLHVQAYHGNLGQFDKREWDKLDRIKGLVKGYIKRDEVAWFSPHLHKDTMNVPYQYAYVYKYTLEAGQTSGTLQLPENDAIKIFAISLAYDPYDQIQPARPLYDDFTDRPAMALNLPKSFVNDQMEPAAKVVVTNNRDLAELPARPTMKDYADIHQPNGVTSQYYFTDADSAFTGSIVDGMGVSAINDGMYDLLPGDSLRDKWSEKGEGRLWMDLQKEIELDSIHIFTAQSTKRGAQSFSLWGAPGDKSPAVKGDPKSAGWSYILTASPEDIWGNSKALYTITPLAGKSKQYRYLLWVSEDSPHGPYYFREVDVFEKQK